MIVDGMTFKEYLDDPCDEPSLSSSTVRALLKTAPKRVWTETKRLNPAYEEKRDPKFDLGTAAHTALIGHGQRMVIVPFDAYRSSAAKAMRDEAYNQDKTPVLESNMDRVTAMAEAAREQFAQNSDIGFMFQDDAQGVKHETSVFWREINVANRCRPDLLALRATAVPIIVHYKTTQVMLGDAGLKRLASDQGWHLIHSHYHAGLKALTGHDPKQFFAVQEVQPPYLTMVTDLSNAFEGTGDMRRGRALKIWARCVATGNWPGHFTRTKTIDIPPWFESKQIADKDAEEAILQREGKDPLDTMMHWQAPEGWKPSE